MDEFGNYLRELEMFPDFREDSIRVSILIEKMRGGDEGAELSLIEATLKYIVELAAYHCGKWNAWPSYQDLVQEANVEVTEKIRKYDPAKASLKDFVSYRAYVAFVRFWHKAKIVRFTDYGRKIVKHLQKAHDELTSELGREPTLEELSTRIGMNESAINAVQSNPGIRMVGITQERQEKAGGNVVNLDSLASEQLDPFARVEASEIRETLIECLGEKDADLLLAYVELGTEGFRSLHLQLHGKELSADAARKAKQRLIARLNECKQFKDRYSDTGGAL